MLQELKEGKHSLCVQGAPKQIEETVWAVDAVGTQKGAPENQWGWEEETRKGLPKDIIAKLSLCGGRGRCRTIRVNSYKDTEACKPITLRD